MRLIVPVVLAMLFSIGASRASAAEDAAPPGPAVDLQRMMGTWYVIARIPNPVERGHVASRDEYTLRGEDKVGIRYVYREGFSEPEQDKTARASVDEDSGNHNWRVWFYKIVPTRQRILEIAPDDSWMLISWPGRDLAWIFARSPDMSTEQYRSLVAKLRDDYGVYTDKLKRVPQRPDQVDKLGFEVPDKR
jgi:apolipoprotein D and lipocalin family protein